MKPQDTRVRIRSSIWAAALLATAYARADVTLESLLGEMTNYDVVARWPQPEFTCKQANSYDRETVAPDKPGRFANRDQNQFIGVETNESRVEKVMLDTDGPGCIVRFWLTTNKDKQGTKVKTFTRAALEAARPAVERVNRTLLAPPHEPRGKAISFAGEVAAGKEHSLELPRGPMAVRRLELSVPLDRLALPERTLRSLIVQMECDSERTVWCPASDFFAGEQDMGPFGGEYWSNGRQLPGKTGAPGDSVEVEFAAPLMHCLAGWCFTPPRRPTTPCSGSASTARRCPRSSTATQQRCSPHRPSCWVCLGHATASSGCVLKLLEPIRPPKAPDTSLPWIM